MENKKIPQDNNDDLFAQLEKQLDEIETSEFIHNMTDDVLADKGFIGNKHIEIPGKNKNTETEKEHLKFAAGVDFERLADDTAISAIDPASLQHLSDVETDTVLATRKADELIPFSAGSGATKSVVDGIECYRSTIRGKVIIIKSKLYVVSADRDCSVSVTMNETWTKAFVTCSPALGKGKPLTEAMISDALLSNNVTFGINNDVISQIIKESESTTLPIENCCVAEGKLPVQGDSGSIEFGFSTNQSDYGFRILPDGRIDYRNTQNILVAKKGQLLARIIPPSQGTAGIDVSGREIPAEKGVEAFLTAGSGVVKSDDGTQFFAEINGSIVQNGSVIEVVNTYVINGDVDFSTGNIDFNGNVLINGNVPDGFEVKADGDIIISKLVESARIEAGRDVIIIGGVHGKGKGFISAGRDIRTAYAQNARLEAQGNIYIENFTINSYVFTSKCLIMQDKRGAIIGGEVFAQRGVDVRVIGSENGVKTFVETGTNYLVMRRISELDVTIDFCDRNILKIDDSLKTLSVRMKSGMKLTTEKKAMVVKALQKKKEIEQKRTVLIAKRNDLSVQAKDRDTCFVKVKQQCFPDVTIKIRDSKTVIAKLRENVRFFEDKKNSGIETAAY